MVDRMIASKVAASSRADTERRFAQSMSTDAGSRRCGRGRCWIGWTAQSPAAKAELLDLLIYVGGAKALAGIGTAANSDDDALADAATQALGKWLTPRHRAVLLDLAQNGNAKYRTRCLRGYIRVIRQFGLRPNQRLKMSRTAFDAATRDEERKLVLDTLTRFPSAARIENGHAASGATRRYSRQRVKRR